MKRIIMLLTLVLITNKLLQASADYELGVQLHSYSNPLNRNSLGYSCEGPFCLFSCECDNKFTFCLRPSGSLQDNDVSNCPIGLFETREFEEQNNINFNQMTNLGNNLSNPFFYRDSGNWPGRFQLYVRVLDIDPANEDDVVDNIYVDMALIPSSSFTTPQTFVGNSDNGRLEMSFRVLCTDGTCQNNNVCTNNTGDNCDTNAFCTNTTGNFTCTCNRGYTGNGVICTDNNECTDNTDNCDTNANCTNTPGSFTCTCNSGYTRNGVTCIDINECTFNTNNCDTNALCTNTPGSFTCTCNHGYTGNGVICTALSITTVNTSESNSSSSVGPIIGGVVGVLLIALLVVIIVIIVVMVYRREGRKKQIPESFKEQSNEDGRYTLQKNAIYGQQTTITSVNDSIYDHIKDHTSDDTSDDTSDYTYMHNNVNDHTSDHTYDNYHTSDKTNNVNDHTSYDNVNNHTSDNTYNINDHTSNYTYDNVNDHTSDNTYKQVMNPTYEEINPRPYSQADDTASYIEHEC